MCPDPDLLSLAVACSPLGDLHHARFLAETLALPFLGRVKPVDVHRYPLLLYADDSGLGLQVTGRGAPGPVRAEFVTGKAGYRREHGGGNGQLIARAVGLQKTRHPLHVVDGTAGLGQDAFVLASLGCRVTLFERSAAVHALLEDGLARAAMNLESAPLIARMVLQPGDSIDWLANATAGAADVVYLDPMFPHRDKSALVKKEMQVFRRLVGDDEDSPALLAAALAVANFRVVVKRPRRAEPVSGPEPTTRIEGKSSRFDVYAIRGFPAS